MVNIVETFLILNYKIAEKIKYLLIEYLINPYLINNVLNEKRNEVRDGPFQGLKYEIKKTHGSAWMPKLFGIYEAELHTVINYISNHRLSKYDVIIDIGAAEGYYLVGFSMLAKRKNLDLNFFGFEEIKERRDVCLKLASINGLSKITLLGKCNQKKLLDVSSKHSKGLIISDCEGYEYSLFNKKTIVKLVYFDLLIELHSLKKQSKIIDEFIERLPSEYSISIIPTVGSIEIPKLFKKMAYPEHMLREIFSEGRINSVGWIFAESKLVNNA